MIFIGNESLQSFIFRHIQIAGGTDFSCVVEDTGAWVSSPRIPEKYQHIFHTPATPKLTPLQYL